MPQMSSRDVRDSGRRLIKLRRDVFLGSGPLVFSSLVRGIPPQVKCRMILRRVVLDVKGMPCLPLVMLLTLKARFFVFFFFPFALPCFFLDVLGTLKRLSNSSILPANVFCPFVKAGRNSRCCCGTTDWSVTRFAMVKTDTPLYTNCLFIVSYAELS